MAITGAVDLGDGKYSVTVDHDPRAVATDVPKGSLIVDANGVLYVKLDDGATTNVAMTSPHEILLAFTFQNNGAVLNTGKQDSAYAQLCCNCEIVACYVFGGPTGSIEFDLLYDSYANYPPGDEDSIVAAAPPKIVSDVKSEDTTLTGWTTALVDGYGMLPEIVSVTNMTWAKVILHGRWS